MQAKDIMSSPVITAKEGDNLEAVANLMLENDVGSVVIVDDAGRAKGIVTESDFIAHEAGVPFSTYTMPKLWGQWIGVEGLERLYEQAREVKASKLMHTPLYTVEEHDSPEQVIEIMLRRQIKHVVVLRDGRPVGIVARHDMLRMMRRKVATLASSGPGSGKA